MEVASRLQLPPHTSTRPSPSVNCEWSHRAVRIGVAAVHAFVSGSKISASVVALPPPPPHTSTRPSASVDCEW